MVVVVMAGGGGVLSENMCFHVSPPISVNFSKGGSAVVQKKKNHHLPATRPLLHPPPSTPTLPLTVSLSL